MSNPRVKIHDPDNVSFDWNTDPFKGVPMADLTRPQKLIVAGSTINWMNRFLTGRDSRFYWASPPEFFKQDDDLEVQGHSNVSAARVKLAKRAKHNGWTAVDYDTYSAAHGEALTFARTLMHGRGMLQITAKQVNVNPGGYLPRIYGTHRFVMVSDQGDVTIGQTFTAQLLQAGHALLYTGARDLPLRQFEDMVRVAPDEQWAKLHRQLIVSENTGTSRKVDPWRCAHCYGPKQGRKTQPQLGNVPSWVYPDKHCVVAYLPLGCLGVA
jgi:hypothetical protein